jgi:DNA-directed RNA polymerase beta' subunit
LEEVRIVEEKRERTGREQEEEVEVDEEVEVEEEGKGRTYSIGAELLLLEFCPPSLFF